MRDVGVEEQAILRAIFTEWASPDENTTAICKAIIYSAGMICERIDGLIAEIKVQSRNEQQRWIIDGEDS